MSFQFTVMRKRAFSGQANIHTGGETLRAAILMTSSSILVPGQQDILTVSGLTTPDEMDGSGYVHKLLSGQIVSVIDTTNHRITWTANPLLWSLLGAGSRNMKGIMIYCDPDLTDNPTHNIPYFWIDDGFPTPATGVDFVYTPNVNGMFYW